MSEPPVDVAARRSRCELDAALHDADLQAAAGRVRARRGRASLRRARARSTSTSWPASRSATPATAIRTSSRRSASRPARLHARLEPLLQRARARGWPSGWPTSFEPGRARVPRATRAPRRTRRRSSWPASTGAAARSSCSRAPSTGARWARCRRRRSPTSRSRSRRSCRASWPCRATTRSALAAAVGERHRRGDARAGPGRDRHLADLRADAARRRARPATAPARC